MKEESNNSDKRKEAKIKAGRFCAYQERTQQEVRNKLYSYGLYSDEVEEVLAELITEGFINEERYAKAFAGGKFRQKKWGKVKIRYQLERKGLTPYCIESGLAEIDDNDYLNTISSLIEQKVKSLEGLNSYQKQSKIVNTLMRKGYEADLVKKIYLDTNFEENS